MKIDISCAQMERIGKGERNEISKWCITLTTIRSLKTKVVCSDFSKQRK